MLPRMILAGYFLVMAAPLPAASYSWDFRNGHFDNLSLVPLGPGAVNLLRPTTDGLRITVPAGYMVKSVGFSPRFQISGDFEITVEYTVLKRSRPESGFGTGPSLYLSMGSTEDPAASLGRLLRPDGQDRYGVFAARVDEGRRIPTARLFDVPSVSTTKPGRLQLKRSKQEITYSVSEDTYSDLRTLVVLPVSAADVSLVRIGLSQSDLQSSGEMILHYIRIDADALPHLPSEQSRTAQLYRPRYLAPPVPKSFRWLWQTLAAVLVACGFAVWLWRRWR